MYSKTDSSPMCARYTVGGGNTPKEWTAIEPKEEEEEQTGWQSPNWTEELSLSELTFPDTIYKLWITLSVDCIYTGGHSEWIYQHTGILGLF